MREESDKVLLGLANRQFGVLRLAQLRAAGLDKSAVSRWVLAGRLTRLHAGVYALGHSVLTPRGRWLAAVWSCGDGAWLSHTSAAAFHELRTEEAGEPVHVSTTASIKSRPGIVVHRVRMVHRTDLFRPHPLVVSNIPRAVVEIADVMPWPELRACADRLRVLDLESVRKAQRRAPNRRGAPMITRLIDADDAHTKSEFERKYLRFCDAASLARPDHLNAWVAGHKADCIYEAARLVIELDGRAHHERRAEMREDRRRDRDYQRARYRIARLVWDDLHPDEAAEAAAGLRAFL